MNVGKVLKKIPILMQRNIKMYIIEAKKRMETYNDFMAIKRFNKDVRNKMNGGLSIVPMCFVDFKEFL